MSNLTKEEKLLLLELCKQTYKNDKEFGKLLKPIFHSPENELQLRVDETTSEVFAAVGKLLRFPDDDILYWWLYENDVGGVGYVYGEEIVCDTPEKLLQLIEDSD